VTKESRGLVGHNQRGTLESAKNLSLGRFSREVLNPPHVFVGRAYLGKPWANAPAVVVVLQKEAKSWNFA